jgi:hypothetical protein
VWFGHECQQGLVMIAAISLVRLGPVSRALSMFAFSMKVAP